MKSDFSNIIKLAGKKKPRVVKKAPKIWSTDKADTEFSLFIRNRDKKCLFPGCSVREIKKLQCSHYIGRAHSATRYDPDNCISLCWLHHFKDKLLGFEYQKQVKEKHGYDGQYTLFMKKLLTKDQYASLIKRGASTMNRKEAIMDCMALVDMVK